MKRLFFIVAFFIVIFQAQVQGKSAGSKSTISDSIDVLHYSIHLNIVNLSYKTISGYADLSITPKVANVGSFRLWLLALTIDSILVNSVPVPNYSYDDTLVRIFLAAPVNPGDTFKLRVRYHGMPVLDPSTWGGFYFSNDSLFAYNIGVGFKSIPHNFGRVWFPCIDDFVDRASYDYYITTQTSKMAVCGGLLKDTINHGNGTKTWHWQMKNTIPSYLASVAVGPYIGMKRSYNGVGGTVPIAIYVRKSDTTAVNNAFVNLNSILSIYETRFGKYRFERVGYVGVPFNAGAMEHATNIAYPFAVLPYGLAYETLYAHELAHMWFGDLVTCSKAEEMWLNEGWARYSEAVFSESLYGKKSYKESMRKFHQKAVQFAHVDDGGYYALNNVPLEVTYGTTSYEKGADILHTLRNYIGDSLFFSTTKQYLNDYAFNHITTEQFRDYFSAKTGINLTSFFDAWFLSPGFPHFSIDSFVINGSNPAMVTVFVRQRLNHAPAYANDNILEVTFMDGAWNKHTDTLRFSGMSGSKTFAVPFVPDAVLLDLNDKVSDAITTNDMVIKTTGYKDFSTTQFALNTSQISDSAFVRVEHNFVPPDPLKTPNPDILKLSDYRYWKVDGIFPPGFIAKGYFRYNRTTNTSNGYLDNTFMTTANSKDSLLLLYRENPAHDWRIVPASVSGLSSTGNLVIDTLRRGEYTLAIGKPYSQGTEKYLLQTHEKITVFPNPSKSEITIKWKNPEAATVKIFSLSGNQTEHFILKPGQTEIIWKPAGNIASGNYVVKVFDRNNNLLGEEKFIYMK